MILLWTKALKILLSILFILCIYAQKNSDHWNSIYYKNNLAWWIKTMFFMFVSYRSSYWKLNGTKNQYDISHQWQKGHDLFNYLFKYNKLIKTRRYVMDTFFHWHFINS